MKKTIKTVLVFGLGMVLATSTLYASGYINWKGTTQVENTMMNLDKLEVIIKQLKEDDRLDTIYLEEQLEIYIELYKHQEELVIQRDRTIKELQDMVIERDNIINELSTLVEQLENDNEQAYEDVKMIDKRVLELLESGK